MAERFLINSYELPEGALVPENLKKKLERNAKHLAAKKTAIAERKSANKVIRHNLKMKSLKYDKEYRKTREDLIRKRRDARCTGNFFVEPEAKLMFVIRITGINKLAPKPRKILKLLRLDQLHKGVFVKVTKPMTNMLKYIQPYIICGYPSLSTVRKLILKRGYGKVAKQRIPLTNNQIISEALGEKCGIHGMDDLIHEIFTVGPNFKQASNFLWPFKLSSPRGGFVRKVHGFNELSKPLPYMCTSSTENLTGHDPSSNNVPSSLSPPRDQGRASGSSKAEEGSEVEERVVISSSTKMSPFSSRGMSPRQEFMPSFPNKKGVNTEFEGFGDLPISWPSSKNSFNKVLVQQTEDTESITNSSDDDHASNYKSFYEANSSVRFSEDYEEDENENYNDTDDDGYFFYDHHDDDYKLDDQIASHDNHDRAARGHGSMSSPLSTLFQVEAVSLGQPSIPTKKDICIGVEENKLLEYMLILDLKSNKNDGHRVLFNYINEKSCVICRSFSKLSRSNSTLESQEYDHITASIQGFRIVQTTLGSHHAEFMINVYINNRNYKIWRRYSRFEAFANTLFENMKDPVCVEDHEEPLFKARESWLNLVENKSWFRDIGIMYLIKKTLRLEQFLQFAVWGLETHEPLFEFLVDEDILS